MASRFPHRSGLSYAPVCLPVYAPDLTNRSQPIRSSACSADPADAELVSQPFFFQHCPCRFHNPTILPFGYAVLLRRIHATQFASSSHLLHITIALSGKVLFPAILPQTLDCPPCFPFDKIFRFHEQSKTSLFFSMRYIHVCRL